MLETIDRTLAPLRIRFYSPQTQTLRLDELSPSQVRLLVRLLQEELQRRKAEP